MALGIASGLSFSARICGGSYLKIGPSTQSSPAQSASTITVTNITDGTRQSNDIISVSWSMYVTDPGGFGGADPVSFSTGFSYNTIDSYTTGSTIDQDTLTSFSIDINVASGATAFLTSNLLRLANFNVGADLPSQGSTVYIKDLVITHKANNGDIKGTKSFDFSDCGDVSMVTGSSKFNISVADYTKGSYLP